MSTYIIFSGKKGEASIDLASFSRNSDIYTAFSEAGYTSGSGDERELTMGILGEVGDELSGEIERTREEIEEFKSVPNRTEEMVNLTITLKRDLKDLVKTDNYLDFLSQMLLETKYNEEGFDKITFRIG